MFRLKIIVRLYKKKRIITQRKWRLRPYQHLTISYYYFAYILPILDKDAPYNDNQLAAKGTTARSGKVAFNKLTADSDELLRKFRTTNKMFSYLIAPLNSTNNAR